MAMRNKIPFGTLELENSPEPIYRKVKYCDELFMEMRVIINFDCSMLPD